MSAPFAFRADVPSVFTLMPNGAPSICHPPSGVTIAPFGPGGYVIFHPSGHRAGFATDLPSAVSLYNQAVAAVQEGVIEEATSEVVGGFEEMLGEIANEKEANNG